MDNKSPVYWRAIATVIVWVMVVGAVTTSSLFLSSTLGEDIIAVIFMILAAAVVSMGFIWNWGRFESELNQVKEKAQASDSDEDDYYDLLYTGNREKRKHGDDRLSDALRSLSDDELISLRERLAAGEITEDELEATLRDRY